jgi:hypothetical protein
LLQLWNDRPYPELQFRKYGQPLSHSSYGCIPHLCAIGNAASARKPVGDLSNNPLPGGRPLRSVRRFWIAACCTRRSMK